MIKPEESRIGNYYYITPFKEEDIIKLTEDHFQLLDIFKKLDRIKPIPITEEWLIKFGFKTDYPNEKGKYYYIDKGTFQINSFNYGKGFRLNTGGFIKYRSIKHVHQLQNLYHSLTGEELTIK